MKIETNESEGVTASDRVIVAGEVCVVDDSEAQASAAEGHASGAQEALSGATQDPADFGLGGAGVDGGLPPQAVESANSPVTLEVKGGMSSSIILIGVLFLTVFVAWAAYFELDQSVRAMGQVIPMARTQIVQVADGGVLAELLVKEGEQVAAGQRVAVLEKDRAAAGVNEVMARIAGLRAGLIRTQAEVAGSAPIFGPEFDAYPGFTRSQMDFYQSRLRTLKDEQSSLQDGLVLAEEELKMNEYLLSVKSASRLEVLRARREVIKLKSSLDQAWNKYVQKAREEGVRLERDLAVAEESLAEQLDVLQHTDILAPTAGVVKYQRINTVGGVVRPGDELLHISPTESELVFEIKIAPKDIGELKSDSALPAIIKLDAFDYSIYGSLEGQLTYVSSDTLTENKSGQEQKYYLARVTVNENYKDVNPKFADLEIKPGMTGSVDIRTGKRTVLRFLMKPILRGFSGALTQK